MNNFLETTIQRERDKVPARGGLPTIKYSWEEWKRKLELGFSSRRNFNRGLQTVMTRRKRPGEITDTLIRTGAAAGNHQTPESLFLHLSSLSTLPGTSRGDQHRRSTRFPTGKLNFNKDRSTNSRNLDVPPLN
ncbi:hypothetical protein GWI33_003866 [Rhynchophorus ferrugineus]|uniref:Uncharacterized protein n=1 Tax=Rhynchophorus ferrugineus TaxID=354439 RepID=A0A834IT26_RHYFE|nr:hypothetical protein GWI33_003866 [Rhynchophorus ferrugineus]